MIPRTDGFHDTPSTGRRWGPSWEPSANFHPSVKPRRWTTVRKSNDGPFCTSVVSICDLSVTPTDPRTVDQSTDRRLQSAHSIQSESVHASGSGAKAASSDEATSSESIPVPRNDDPTPVAAEPNRWCVEGQWQIYRDAKMINDKQKMARTITEERRVLTGSLHTVPEIHRLFNLHKCDWMARDPGTYSEEIVQEFYALYAATLRGSITKRSKPLAQDPLTSTMVRGALDIGLIRDEANVAAPRREPQIEVPPLGPDLADTVGQAQGGDPIITDHVDTVRCSSYQATSVAPISSRMEAMMDRKVKAVNKRLDAFELRDLEQSTPATDLSTLQADVANLRTDINAIFAAPSIETQAAPTALADDTVLEALFSGTAEEGPAPTHAKGKRHRSDRTEE
uniref:Integrase core domain containing protein n=1 Tax=Solanum tuberosum TaxID=4113 RepID=M1DZG9_SOLTU